MMISEQNIGEWAEKFLRNELNNEEKKAIERALAANEVLEASWNETITLLQLLKDQEGYQRMKQKVKSVRAGQFQREQDHLALPGGSSRSGGFKKYMWVAAVAAALVLITSLATLWIVNLNSEQTGAQYLLLRREIETIKHSQSHLMDSIRTRDGGFSGIAEEGHVFAGTGFALSNDGYIATNYHVVKDAATIFVQTADGKDWKAYVLAFEPTSDVAILKIEDQDFSFGEQPLPYTFKTDVAALGQTVFSLGYPQESLVYNEGYVSCEQGFEGDSSSYQLELVANPGQSGAPVMDKKGHIIALITGKQSNTSGKTYAVHADAVLALIQTLPQKNEITLSSDNTLAGLSRVQQVNRMREYICAVKVN